MYIRLNQIHNRSSDISKLGRAKDEYRQSAVVTKKQIGLVRKHTINREKLANDLST